jgi:hypothetical protein
MLSLKYMYIVVVNDGSWIYHYLFIQCLSPLTLWVRIPFMARCTRNNFMWYVCQWLMVVLRGPMSLTII